MNCAVISRRNVVYERSCNGYQCNCLVYLEVWECIGELTLVAIERAESVYVASISVARNNLLERERKVAISSFRAFNSSLSSY